MDPKQMKQLMRQFGIKSEDLAAKKVIFELEGKKLIVEKPSVTVMEIQGKKTYTVMGEAKEEALTGADAPGPEIPDGDIEMVAQQANATKENARKALEETKGDIAEAIEKLKG